MFDNSAGLVITNSTNSLSNSGAMYLNYGSLPQSLVLKYLRCSYASNAISGTISSTANSITIWDCQFFDCATAFNASFSGSSVHGFPLNVYNVLFSTCTNAINANTSEANYLNVAAINVTADQVGSFLPADNSGSAVNSLFTSVTNINISLSHCATNASSTGIYQSVGAANYYLANGSSNVNAGTASINSVVLTNIQTLTTYPPIVYSNALTTNLVLSSRGLQNTGAPDIGYHYSPIDFALNMAVSNASLTVQPGTVLAGYGTNGIYLSHDATLNCIGTAVSPVWLVQYNTVQEQSNTNWASTNWSATLQTQSANTGSSATCSFTDWSSLAGAGQIAGETAQCQFTAENCQFSTGNINENGLYMACSNCLFVRPNFTITDDVGNVAQTFFNNLFWQGKLSLKHKNSGLYTFRDNFFDQTAITTVGTVTIDACKNNGYVTSTNGVLTPESHDVILTNSPAYQAGALGSYYYPTNFSPTNTLIHSGSQLASAAGLYHYTVLTNAYSIEGTNTVSIGFHYVGVDANGWPLDTNGDGLPDYVKDSNGDGVYDAGDLANWLSPFNIYDQGTSFEGWVPPYVRLGYWRFNTNSTSTNYLTNQGGIGPMTDSNLGLSNSFSGTAVSLTASLSDLVYPVTSNGVNYFNPGNGSIRFWFQPNWSSVGSSGPNLGSDFGGIFFCANSSTGGWQFYEWNTTNNTSFIKLGTSISPYQQKYSFVTGGLNGAPVNFQSNLWCQIVLTYSPTNVALYTNGVFLASATYTPIDVTTGAELYGVGNGNVYYPPVGDLTSGFSFGDESGFNEVMGQLDELETFNYPLTAQQVAAGYPYFGGNSNNMVDTYYIGVSDMLQTNVYGFPHPAATNSIPVRLGYWRFDSPLLYGEQGQVPLSFNSVSLTNSWSGTALNVVNNGQVTYPDVGSNGWANINCRQGSLRFWFKPNAGGPNFAPFVYVGTPNGSQQWQLESYYGGDQISFLTASNNVTNYNLTAACNLSSTTNWSQIVLTYGTYGCSLYINGQLVKSGSAVTYWPSLTNQNLPLVIGNNAAYTTPINGQFEEMETFNYQLTASDILSNFQVVASVDSDLDGIPDLLEDIKLTVARPFLGAPVVITGTIEAEQFDIGSNGVGYFTTNSALHTLYRPSKMVITNCNDLGLGYCLDQTHAGDWTQYSINVRVPQTYMVEVRAEAVGTDTGGIFRCEFTNSSGFNTNTGSLTNTTTNWTNLSAVVYLQSGPNVMKLHCLTNAAGGTVGRFNYISIYPYWSPPTNGPGSKIVAINTAPTNTPNGLLTGTDFLSASNNASWIQQAIDGLPANGGTVTIPTGTWYVSQAVPNDTNDANKNAAFIVRNNNIEIAGEGTSNTVLIAHNRSTTILCLGHDLSSYYQCTNFILRDITLEANPHEVATNSGSGNYTNIYELGQLALNGGVQGSIAVLDGKDSTHSSYNICISNCVFLHGLKSLYPYSLISNIMVVDCQFFPFDTNCYFTGTMNNYPSNTLNTVGWQANEASIIGDGPYNAVITGNTYIGNSALIAANTNALTNILAPDGFVWFQGYSGNVFVARNVISNNELEAVQLEGGPNSVVGNTNGTLVSDGSCCAFCVAAGSGAVGLSGPTGSLLDSIQK